MCRTTDSSRQGPYPRRVTSPRATLGLASPGPSESRTATGAGRVGRRHLWTSVGGAGGVATGAYVLLSRAVVPGAVSLVVVGLLLAAIPTSPLLARRVALNGSFLIGWTPVLWWSRWPFPVDHAALVVAVAVGGLVVLVAASDDPRARLRGLVPEPRLADLLIPVGGVLALVAMGRWAFPGSPRRALVAMLPGADNYAHFHMFSTIRAYGAVTPAAGPAPDGAPWGFDEYPQGFHALAATLSELMHPHVSVGPQMLVVYTQAVTAVIVLGVVVTTAAFVSLPGIRDLRLAAVPLVVLTWAAFLWKPGQHLLADGFANFWLAAAAAGCALVLSLAPQRRLALPEVVAVGGLLVVVAHAWAPLVVIAAPAVLALYHPLPETFHAAHLRHRLLVSTGVLLLAGAGVLKALVGLFADVHVEDLVTSWGGIHGTRPLPAFVLLVAGIYLCSCSAAIVRRRGGDDEAAALADRARVLVLAPVAGLVLGTVLFVAQLRTIGTSSYYFLKLFMGFELILVVLVPALAGVVLAHVGPRIRGRVPAALLVVVATVLATQAFGRFPQGFVPLFDGGEGTALMRPPFSATRIADGIVAAAAHSTSRQAVHQDYLAVGPDRAAQPFYPDGWYHGVLASLSTRVQERLDVQRHPMRTRAKTALVAGRLLRSDPRLVLVVDPRVAESLQEGLSGTGLARRVVPWSARASVQAQGER